MIVKDLRSLIFLVALLVLSPTAGAALPFNDDMVNSPVMTGKIMRPLPQDSVSEGSNIYPKNRDEALRLTNPLKGDRFSAQNGRRLYQINCTPCHGDIEAKPYVPGKVTKFLPGPNLTLPLYHDTANGRSDAYIYATIHFGSIATLMPRLGWKFSPTEHWDIVNYIRLVQSEND